MSYYACDLQIERRTWLVSSQRMETKQLFFFELVLPGLKNYTRSLHPFLTIPSNAMYVGLRSK